MKKISFDTIPSTNTYCVRNIENLEHGSVAVARRQSEGRGRKNRVWSSEEGGLYFSVVLKDGVSSLNAPGTLTQIMALSVCCAARKKGVAAYIKWPNDVLAEGRKFCGILSEAVFDGAALKAVVVGAGVNLAQKKINSEKPAATLASLGVNIEAEVFLEEILENFNFNYELLKQSGFEPLRSSFKEAFAYLGKTVNLKVFEENITGIAEDIDQEGRLILSTADGRRVITVGDMDF